MGCIFQFPSKLLWIATPSCYASFNSATSSTWGFRQRFPLIRRSEAPLDTECSQSTQSRGSGECANPLPPPQQHSNWGKDVQPLSVPPAAYGDTTGDDLGRDNVALQHNQTQEPHVQQFGFISGAHPCACPNSSGFLAMHTLTSFLVSPYPQAALCHMLTS